MPFVLDASIAGCWAFDDEDHPVAAVALERVRTDEARVPSLWWFEVRNTPIVNERRGRLTERDTAAFLRGLVGLPVTLDRSPKEGDTRACPPPPPYSLLRSSGIPRASPKTFSRQGRKWTGKGLETGIGSPFGVNPTERRNDFRQPWGPKSGLQRFRFSGNIRTANTDIRRFAGTPARHLGGFCVSGAVKPHRITPRDCGA
jgi:hypothetical protein